MGSSKAKVITIPVSKRALIQRINRRLAKEGRVIKATRGERYRDGLGDFYKVYVHNNMIEDAHIDLETLGRKLRVLQPYERLEEDPNV